MVAEWSKMPVFSNLSREFVPLGPRSNPTRGRKIIPSNISFWSFLSLPKEYGIIIIIIKIENNILRKE